MITTMFFLVVPLLERALRIIILLARNAEKGGGVLMPIILPNLKHSFICLILFPFLFPFPFPFPVLDFQIFHTPTGTASEFNNMKDWKTLKLEIKPSFKAGKLYFY